MVEKKSGLSLRIMMLIFISCRQSFICPDISFVISMPYCPGGTLRSRLHTLTPELTERFFLQMASAVEYLHFRGVAHRDIKPDNLLLDSEDRILLSDFGLASQVTYGTKMVQGPCRRGTVGYKAPEMDTDGTVDLFKVRKGLHLYLHVRLLRCSLRKTKQNYNGSIMSMPGVC